MAAASGLSVWEISQAVSDWYLTGNALKAAGVELVNYAIHLPMSHLYGLGDTCSAEGMRFYVPVDILAAERLVFVRLTAALNDVQRRSA